MSHHLGHVGLVLGALALKETDDDGKTGCGDLWVIATLSLVEVQNSHYQYQSLRHEKELGNTYQLIFQGRIMSVEKAFIC